MSEQTDTQQPEGLVNVETATEWQRTIFLTPGVEQTITYDSMQHAVDAQMASPKGSMVARVETTYYLMPEEAAKYTKWAADEAEEQGA